MHKGHIYQLSKIKEKYPNAFYLALMSGNFCQRGEISLFSKELKSKLALHAGFDLVLELEQCYAIASAQEFAKASCKTLASLNLNLEWVFGAECDDIALLFTLAETMLLAEKNMFFNNSLKNKLKQGFNYPKAYHEAYLEFLNISQNNVLPENKINNLQLAVNKLNILPPFVKLAEILKSSNNILALEYIKAYLNLDKKFRKKINLSIIKREGHSYLDENIQQYPLGCEKEYISINNNINNNCNNHMLKLTNPENNNVLNFASASMLRQRINYLLNKFKKREIEIVDFYQDSLLKSNLPNFVMAALLSEINKLSLTDDDYNLMSNDHLLKTIINLINVMPLEYLEQINGFNKNLIQRAKYVCEKKLYQLDSYNDLLQNLTSKNTTKSSINRALISLVLGIRTDEALTTYKKNIEKIQVLTLSKRGRYLLKIIKKQSSAILCFGDKKKQIFINYKAGQCRLNHSNCKNSEYFCLNKAKKYIFNIST